LGDKKGVDTAIRAVARTIYTSKQLHCSVVGDAVPLGKLKEIVNQFGISNKVSFFVWNTHSDILTLLRGSHILIAPSVTADSGDQEGIPNVMKEAMAAGLPVIGTLYGGIPEHVEHGKAGFPRAEGDADSVADALVYLCEHPEISASVRTETRAFNEGPY